MIRLCEPQRQILSSSAWAIYALGYALGIFAIAEDTIANYVLPIYMALGASTVAMILALLLFRKRAPFQEWV